MQGKITSDIINKPNENPNYFVIFINKENYGGSKLQVSITPIADSSSFRFYVKNYSGTDLDFYICGYNTDFSIYQYETLNKRTLSSGRQTGQTNFGATFSEATEVDNFLLDYTCDIYNTSGSEVVFQAPPQQVEGVLAPVVKKVELEEVTQEIIKIIPLIIAVVVSFLGLHKGLALLFRILHNS